MWYLVLRRDVAPRQTWTATLDEHLGWMKAQHASGSVLFSGPTADIRTGIYVIRAASTDEARRIAADDPFTRAGHCTFDLYEWDVRQILGTLPPDYRAVMVLRHFQQLAYEEIAEVLGLSLSQVKTRLFRARKMFKDRFEAFVGDTHALL